LHGIVLEQSVAFTSVASCLIVMTAISPNKPYRVGRSRTGLGLFAIRPIKKGTKIIRYFGPLLDCRKKRDDAIENKYLFELNGRWTIDGSVRKNVARYINHSCKPNAESDVKPRKRKVFIRAIKNIGPGEEINYDYGTDYFKAYLKPIGCKCAACEKKRRKKRAEARAEGLRLKARAERKALRQAEKEAAKAQQQLMQKELMGTPKLEQKQRLSGKTAHAKAGSKPANGKLANGKLANGIHLNGRFRNGHGRSKAASGRSAAAKPRASTKPEVAATAVAGERQASA
jgi:uncharacterized protein